MYGKIKSNKKVIMAKKLLLFVPLRICDVIITLFFFIPFIFIPSAFYQVVRIREFNNNSKKKGKNDKVNILRIPEGSGDLQSIFQKYNTVDVYFNQSLVYGFSDLVIFSNFWTLNNYQVRLRDDFVLMETVYRYNFPFVSSLNFLLRNLRVIRKFNVILIHSNSPYKPAIFGLILAKLARKPFCVSIHTEYEKSEALQGNIIPKIFGSIRVSRLVERLVYKEADLVLPIRSSMNDYLIRAGCDEKKIRIFPHGINVSSFSRCSAQNIKALFGIPEGAKVISSAGRIEYENYCDDLVEIAMRSVKRWEEIYFIISGDGTQLDRLKNKVNTDGLKNRIILPGYVANEIVVELRKQSYINLCLMGGFSLIEACAAGNPVISYDVEWHSELVENGVTGFLIKENDVDSVFEKIEYLLRNPKIAKGMGQNAQKRAFEKHSLETTSKSKALIYEELLAKSSK